MKTAIELIAAERQRQIESEGWTLEHDDEHDDGEMARAAASYCVHASGYIATAGCLLNGMGPRKNLWPWAMKWWKPTEGPDSEIRDLVKAGALIVAEIERRQREQPEARGEEGD